MIALAQEKFYLADPALRYSVLGYNADSAASMPENIVYLELLRRGYDVTVGKPDGFEIDFIATKRDEKIYVQVAKEIKNGSTREGEYGVSLRFKTTTPNTFSRTMIMPVATTGASKPSTSQTSF